MDVTVVKVVDPAKPTHSVFGRKKGNRFVAIRIELINSGTKMYSDTSSTGAALIDDKLHRYDAYDAYFTGLVGPGFGSPKIGPGDKRAGSITFEVPDGRTPIIPVQTGLRVRAGHGAMVALGPLYDRRSRRGIGSASCAGGGTFVVTL